MSMRTAARGLRDVTNVTVSNLHDRKSLRTTTHTTHTTQGGSQGAGSMGVCGPRVAPPQKRATTSDATGQNSVAAVTAAAVAAHNNMNRIGGLTAEVPLSDPQLCIVYEDRIQARLREAASDPELIPSQQPLQLQREITQSNRQVLLEWMVEVHMKFRLQHETLFLAQNIVDRYLDRIDLVLGEFQLLGVTALFIASKVEEIRAPELRDFVFITDSSCGPEALMEMEVSVLNTLGFKLTIATPLQLLLRMLTITENQLESQHRFLSQYMLETTLIDARFLRRLPLHLAGGVEYLSRRLLKLDPAWPESLAKITGMTEAQAKDIAKEVYTSLPQQEQHNIIRTKFAKNRYMNVSSLL